MVFFYNLSLFVLLVLFFPKLLIDFCFRRKYRKSLLARLSPKAPNKEGTIWLHAVSMGETKALSTLVPHIRRSYPDAFIFVTTVTETGQKQAETIKGVDACHFLPLDFSWIIRSFVKALQPRLLILVEGDYWLNLLSAAKQCGSQIFVVNGKLSEKSMKRYLSFRSFSRRLFSKIDHFFLQGELYLERFLKIGILPDKLTITGNLKFDIPGASLEGLDLLRKEWNLGPTDKVITLGSTHGGEEDLLLKQLTPFLEKDPHLKVLVVPRHPERFQKVKESLQRPQVIVVDRMGILPKCYRLSHLAIVGGSFVKGVGGHDIFEPAKMGVPTLFGPHMHTQVDLDNVLTKVGAAWKVTPLELTEAVQKLLFDKTFHSEMSARGKSFAREVVGASSRTWNHIEKLFSLERNS